MVNNEPEEIELDDELHHDLDSDSLVRNRHHKISIQRELLNEKTFEEGFRPVKSSMRKDWWNTLRPPEPIRSSLKPPTTLKGWRKSILSRIPILTWLWMYQLKWLIDDIIAGVTVAIMRIPQGLAYALLAGLPAVTGLYVSFIPVLVYSVFGSSRHLSVGTFAVVSLMVNNAIATIFSSDPSLMPCLDSDTENDTMVMIGNLSRNCSSVRIDVAVTLSFLSGIIMLLMGIFRLGFITLLLSESLISGYTTGAAVLVFTSQLKHIFGTNSTACPTDVPRGVFNVPRTWISTVGQIVKWPECINNATVIISIISIIALVIFRVVDRSLLRKLKVPCWFYSRKNKVWEKKKIKWPIPLPAQLIVVIVAAGLSFGFSFHENFGVNIVKEIPLGLPGLTLLQPNFILALLPNAFVVAIITFAITVSVGQVFAQQLKYSINSDQELLAYGIMNIIGSLFSCFPSSGGLSRTTVQVVSGGKTQLVGIVSSVLLLFVILWIGFLFEPLPNAVLAAIIWVALYGMFTQVVDIWRYFKLSIPDLLIWLVVFVATVLLGIDYGLGVGVGFSLFIIVFRIILPRSSVLGQVGNTEIFRNAIMFEEIKLIPGVVIYRFQAPVCFINCKVFLAKLELACKLGPRRPQAEEPPGCIAALWTKMMKSSGLYKVSKHKPPNDNHSLASVEADDSRAGNRNGRSNSLERALQNDIVDSLTNSSTIHTLILDCAPMGFMDAMGVKTLKQLVLDYDGMGVQVLFAAMTKENRDMLDRAGFFELCGKEWLFPSIQDAVNHAVLGDKLHPSEKEEPLQRKVTTDHDDEGNDNRNGNEDRNNDEEGEEDDHESNHDDQDRAHGKQPHQLPV